MTATTASSPGSLPRLRRAAAAALVLAAVAAGLAGCDKPPAATRKMQMVKLLPDTPPPPPPPKPDEKKPEPPKEDRPQAQPQVQPKQVEVPQPQALKTDEAAGDGPGNGMVAGAVTKDYAGETIGSGGGSGGPEVVLNRLTFTSYANATTRALNEFLARDKDLKLQNYKVNVNLWLQPDGGVERVELAGSSGDPAIDDALRTALTRFPGNSSRPPENLPQPLRLLVSNRLMG
jgi:periplasmic protein TonB